MAKSKHISGLLLLAFVCVHLGIAGNIIENQEPRSKSQDLSGVNMGSRGIKEISREDRKARVKEIYESQIGVKEKGTNRGPQVERYLKHVGLASGQPWCAAFVCWVFSRAGVANPRSGWSPDLFPASRIIWVREPGTKSKEQGLPPSAPYVYTTSLAIGNSIRATPNKGDIFGLYFPEKRRIAHVGFIDQWDDKWLITVEGNTNNSGSREGDGVYRKRRPVRSIYRVARYIN